MAPARLSLEATFALAKRPAGMEEIGACRDNALTPTRTSGHRNIHALVGQSLSAPCKTFSRSPPIFTPRAVDLYLRQQGVDASTPAGKALSRDDGRVRGA